MVLVQTGRDLAAPNTATPELVIITAFGQQDITLLQKIAIDLFGIDLNLLHVGQIEPAILHVGNPQIGHTHPQSSPVFVFRKPSTDFGGF